MKSKFDLHADEIDLKIIGIILSAETSLHVFPTDVQMFDSVLQALIKIPGVIDCALCIKGHSNLIGSISPTVCSNCNFKKEIPSAKSDNCLLFESEEYQTFPLKTTKDFFGYMIVKIEKQKVFQLYTAFINNFANAISIVMENRRQHEKLSIQNRELQEHRNQLEILVKERTEALEKSERLLSTSQYISHVGGFEYNVEKNTVFWTEEVFRIHGMDPENAAEDSQAMIEASIACYQPQDQKRIREAFEQCVAKGIEYDLQLLFTRLNGEKIWIRTTAQPIVKDGKISKVVGIIMDITDIIETQKELEKVTAQQKAILMTAMDGFWLTDLEGKILDVNDTYCRMSGYRKDELLNLSIYDLEVSNDANSIASHLDHIRKFGTSRFETQQRQKNGQVFDVEISAQYQPFDNGRLVVFIQDITVRKEANNKIKASLAEKETLLQEVHHRVKNNMQVIASLLKLQADTNNDINVSNALKESQTRVYAMSAVHETLYTSTNLSEIEFKYYLTKIVGSLTQTYSVDPQRVVINIEADNVTMGIDKASPLGLALNELLSNSFKYAFPGDRKGEVTISIHRDGKDNIELIVEDDGVGFPADFEWESAATLGLKLVKTLIEDQLDGEIFLDSKNGTKFVINFGLR